MLYGCNDLGYYDDEARICDYCGGYLRYANDNTGDTNDTDTQSPCRIRKYWDKGKTVYVLEIEVNGDININLPGGIQNIRGLQYVGKYTNGSDDDIEFSLFSNDLKDNIVIKDSLNNALQNAFQNALQNDAFRDTFRNALRNAFRNALRNALRNAFRNSFRDNDNDALRNFLRNSLRDNEVKDNQIEDNFSDFLKK